MKKLKFLIFLSIIFLFLTACGRKDDTNSHENFLPNQENIGTEPVPPQEEKLSNFSTEIKVDDPDRDTNIDITCEKLNETIIKSGETFSFTKTVGDADPDEGYKKADIFNGNRRCCSGIWWRQLSGQ